MSLRAVSSNEVPPAVLFRFCHWRSSAGPPLLGTSTVLGVVQAIFQKVAVARIRGASNALAAQVGAVLVWYWCGAGVRPGGAGAVVVWCRNQAGAVLVWYWCGAGMSPGGAGAVVVVLGGSAVPAQAGAVLVWCWGGCGAAQAGAVLVWCWSGTGVVSESGRCGTGMVLAGTGVVRYRLRPVRYWCGAGLVLVWCRD